MIETTFTYGDLSIEGTKLHPKGLESLVRKGISHLFGNEQAARVTPDSTWYKDYVKDNGHIPDKDAIASAKRDFQEAALKALYDGTVGTRAGGGPRLDPIVAEMTVIARREISEVLKGQGIKKFPAGEETVVLGTDRFTGPQLVERRLAKHGDRLRSEAERIIAEREKKAAKLRAEAQEIKSVQNADSLGL